MDITAKSNRWDYAPLWIITATGLSDLPNMLSQAKAVTMSWSQWGITDRIACIKKFLALYVDQKDYIAKLISLEIGKAISHAKADLDYDIGYIQWHLDNAEAILKPEVTYEDEYSAHTAFYEAHGVVGVISPWNYPSSQRVWEIIPPLLAGNVIIYKCSSACMRTAQYINNLLLSCLPPWVFQPIYGDSNIGSELTKLELDLFVFTGSTKVGQTILENTVKSLWETHLELGGSAPGIILPDSPIDDAMMNMIDISRVWHAGQICDGLKRLFVHTSQYEELLSKLSDYFSNIPIGNPLDPNTRMGSLISAQALQEAQSSIDTSIQMGAREIKLGTLDKTPWVFMQVILLTDITFDMPVMKKEIFAPVLPIMKYEHVDQAIEYANHTIYWLWWYLWWKDPIQIDYVCSRLKTANIAVNNTSYLIPQIPFWGYTWSSGNFREHGIIWLRSYTKIKVVSRRK